MTVVLGDALVRVRPDMDGFGAKVNAQVGSETEQSGTKIGRLFGGALKAGALGVTAAAGGLLGAALVKGFQRLNAIDQARAKLEGLGHSTRTVDQIMSNALASVKGTAFGLDEAATVSASAVAAGIKPGQQLTKTLKLVADAATIGGTSMGEMGAIFNKVATSNKVQGDVINQLNDRGIPIVQLLGKSMHKTAAEVMDMSKKGKIGFADFSKAMQEGVGGAALRSGNTFTGAYKNLMASVGRIGAGLLGGIFPHLAPALSGITTAMAPLEKGAGALGDKIGTVLAPAFERLGPWLSKLPGWIDGIDFSHIGDGSKSLDQAGNALSRIGDSLKGVDLSQLASAFGQGAADSISVFSVAIGFAADHIDTLAAAMPALIAAFVVYKAAQAAANVLAIAHLPITTANAIANIALARSNNNLAAAMVGTNAVENVGILTRVRGTVATIASSVASRAAAGAARVWAAGQWVLNAALSDNPIGIVIAIIAALVVGLVVAYKKSSTFRSIVQGALRGVATAGKWMWNNVLQPVFAALVAGLGKGWAAAQTLARLGKAAFNALGAAGRWLWNNALQPAFRFIVKGVAGLLGMWAKMLGALSHVPGFGWAKGAAAAMANAAQKANAMADGIRKIPANKTSTISIVTIRSERIVRAAQAANNRGNIGTNATGTESWRGGLTRVGEMGPEVLALPRGTKVYPAGRSKAMLAEEEATSYNGGRGRTSAPLIGHAVIRETVDLERYERMRAFRERMADVSG